MGVEDYTVRFMEKFKKTNEDLTESCLKLKIITSAAQS